MVSLRNALTLTRFIHDRLSALLGDDLRLLGRQTRANRVRVRQRRRRQRRRGGNDGHRRFFFVHSEESCRLGAVEIRSRVRLHCRAIIRETESMEASSELRKGAWW